MIYRIRAHYYPGRVIVGTVHASDKHAALIVAEGMGLLDDPEAVDFTDELIPPPPSNGERKEGE